MTGVFRTTIFVLFFITLLALAAISGVSTSYLTSDGMEHTFFVSDCPLNNVLLLVALLALGIACRKLFAKYIARINETPRLFVIIEAILLLLECTISLIWVAETRVIPGSDAMQVQNAVIQSFSGDFESFANDEYMGTYKNQFGLFWISYLFASLFGPNNYLAFECFNSIGVTLASKMLADLARGMGASNVQQLLVILLSIAFFPLLQYASFVYGTIWGLSLALVALKNALLFLSIHEWPHAVKSALAICFSMLFKGNYQVFFIGIALCVLVELFKRPQIRTIAFAGMLAASFCIQAVVPVQLARIASDYPLDQGCASLSWVAMGLQEGDRAPGWYNEYNIRSYEASGYDTKKQSLSAEQRITESFRDFSNDPDWAAAFFVQKTASQWNNPTFQGFWNAQVRYSESQLGDITRWLMSANGVDAIAHYLDRLQFVILTGALLWCLFVPWATRELRNSAKRGDEGSRKPETTDSHPHLESLHQTAIPLVFMGGFFCHLIWEAKCQYTLPYFELLIPLSIIGLSRLSRFICSVFQSISARRMRREDCLNVPNQKTDIARRFDGNCGGMLLKASAALFAVFLIAMFANSPSRACLTDDDLAYAEYLDSNPVVRITTSPPESK